MTMCEVGPVEYLIVGCAVAVIATDIVITAQTVKALSKRGFWTATIPIIGLCIILGGTWNANHTFAGLPSWVMVYSIPPIRLGFWIRDACRAGSPARSKIGIVHGIWLLLVSAICGLAFFCRLSTGCCIVLNPQLLECVYAGRHFGKSDMMVSIPKRGNDHVRRNEPGSDSDDMGMWCLSRRNRHRHCHANRQGAF